MRAVFYLTEFSARRELRTPKVNAANIFPNFNDKVKSKTDTCKIGDYTIPEANRPLRFFNSLFLLRTTPNTISCQAIAHIADALNGKLVDWPALYREIILTELKNIKEELFKDKTTLLKSMIAPPLTMLLIDGGLLTVSQEIEAGILMPANFIEKPVSKKRKLGPSMELTPGESSEKREAPQICVAMATTIAKPKANPNIVIELGKPSQNKENPLQIRQNPFKEGDSPNTLSATMEPKIDKNVLISTMENGTSQSILEPLTNILQRFRNTTQLLENWISVTTLSSNGTQDNYAFITESEKFNPLPQRGISRLQDQTLQLHYAPAVAQSTLITATPQPAHTEFRS